jgi:hypothetical protein
MLGVMLHVPRVSFYSPKGQKSSLIFIWKALIAFCLRVHRTVRCTPDSEQSQVSFLLWRSQPLLATGPMAHQTVRWRTGQSGATW